MARVKVPDYSLKEELINAISHGVGAVFSVVALILCILKAHTTIGLVSSIIYTTIMILLYVISCVYHALSPRVKGKKVLRVIDHCNVMLMVAGTYMPVCLALIGGTLGFSVFTIVWIITIVGVVFNAINVDKYQMISAICNLLLGWGIMFLVNPILKVCPMQGVWFLLFGGISYTIGSVLYAMGSKVPYAHSIFHFFVLIGCLFHFLFIYLYCI